MKQVTDTKGHIIKKWIWQIVLFLLIAAIMASCYGSKGYYAGTYRIKSLQGDTATFRGIRGTYIINGKKAKIGLKIHLYGINDSTKVNVVRIK